MRVRGVETERGLEKPGAWSQSMWTCGMVEM